MSLSTEISALVNSEKATEVTVAIDPGSLKSGVAFYREAKLVLLESLDLMDLMGLMQVLGKATWVIEDVLANRFMYGRNQHASKAAAAKISQNVGQVKNTQTQILLAMKKVGIEPVKIKPTKGNWGTLPARQGNRCLREITGWRGSSNKDTRSAAFFGYLYTSNRYRRLTRNESALDWRSA